MRRKPHQDLHAVVRHLSNEKILNLRLTCVISSRATEIAGWFGARYTSLDCYSIADFPFGDAFTNLGNFTCGFVP